jgi:hypothetical protein
MSGVGVYPVRGDVPSQGVSEQVPIADELGPWFYASGDATLNAVGLGEVAGRDPKSFDGETDHESAVPRGLIYREDLTKLFEGGDQSVKRLVRGHSARAPTAPGTSSVMTWT